MASARFATLRLSPDVCPALADLAGAAGQAVGQLLGPCHRAASAGDVGEQDAMDRVAAICDRAEAIAQQLAELSLAALELARYGREAVQRDTDPAPAAPEGDPRARFAASAEDA